MAKVSVEVRSRVGRIVEGHPMEIKFVKDNKTNPPVIKKDKNGVDLRQIYFALAIPKQPGETHWNQTPEGQMIWRIGQEAWLNGETQRHDFAWKVEDGDSTIPNKKGKKNCDKEGFPGHWIFKFSTMLVEKLRCFHLGKYHPTQQIQQAGEIKRGDYVRVFFDVTDNAPSESPGVYINPLLVELNRQGVAIL